MARRIQKFYPSACHGKVRHPTQQLAAQQRRQLHQDRGDTNLDVYRCALCRGWHVGHHRTVLKAR